MLYPSELWPLLPNLSLLFSMNNSRNEVGGDLCQIFKLSHAHVENSRGGGRQWVGIFEWWR